MDGLLIDRLKKNYKLKELRGLNYIKYKAKYIYADIEKYKNLLSITVENVKDIVDAEKFRDCLDIVGIELEGITPKKKTILSVRFYLQEDKVFYLIPLDNDLKEVIYFDEFSVASKRGEQIYQLKDAMKRIRRYSKQINSLGYFDEYKDNEKYYLEALRKFNGNQLFDFSKINMIIDNVIDAEFLLEKIDIESIDNKKLLSNIYYIKSYIYVTKAGIFGIRYENETYDCWCKALEYNPQNINLLRKEFDKPIKEIINMVDRKFRIDKFSRDVEQIGIAIKNLEFEDMENFVYRLADEDILKEIKNTLQDEEVVKFKTKLLKMYQNLLEKLENNEVEENYLEIVKKIVLVLSEGALSEEYKAQEEKLVNDMDINSSKQLANALYLSGNYNDAIGHYKKIIEYSLNKDIDRNIKKDVYEKLISSYIKISDYENARLEYKNAVEEFENEKIFKLIEKKLNK